MNSFYLWQNSSAARVVPSPGVVAKSLLLLFFSFFLFLEAYADNYCVTASTGLNVRASSNKNGEVLGKLSKNDIINVTSIENGWAKIKYNGRDGYVSTSYLKAVSGKENADSSSKKGSWSFFSWLFNSEGEAAWFTGLKWIFFLGLAIFLVKVALQFLVKILALGIVFGGIALLVGLLIKWIGWIESGTMWNIAEWGFYIGGFLGFLDSIFHFGDILDGAMQSWSDSSSSSSVSSDGLKIYEIEHNGQIYTLKQDSRYSECYYTDQDGNKWSCDSQGFHWLGR